MQRHDRLAGIPRRVVGCLPYSVIPLDEAIDLVVELGTHPGDDGITVHLAPA